MRTPVKKKGTLLRVLRYVGKYPCSLVISLLFSLVSVVGTLLVPVLFGDAIDCMIEGNVQMQRLLHIFLLIAACVGVSAFAQWLSGVCKNRICCNVVRDLRKDAF